MDHPPDPLPATSITDPKAADAGNVSVTNPALFAMYPLLTAIPDEVPVISCQVNPPPPLSAIVRVEVPGLPVTVIFPDPTTFILPPVGLTAPPLFPVRVERVPDPPPPPDIDPA